MDIKDQLLSGRNKWNVWDIANYIGADEKRFATLWNLFFEEEAPIPQYAAWVFEKCGEINPQLMQPYIGEMIEYMQGPVHQGIRRSFAKVLSLIEIPEDYTGDLYDLCLDWIIQEKTAVAIKVHCMAIAANIAMPYPELKEELSLVIRDQVEHHTSAGIRSRGNKLLKRLAK